MANETKHTPGPWTYDNFVIYAASGWTVARVGDGEEHPACAPQDDANARRIVECVNAHDSLVAAITGLLNCTELNLDDMEGDTRYMIENARAVIDGKTSPADTTHAETLAALIELERVESGPCSETVRFLAREQARAVIRKCK